MSDESKYHKAVTVEQKVAEIQTATSVAELDEMWAAWESRGWSREGGMFGVILQRKQELGHELSEAEKTTLAQIVAAVKRGKTLPVITARKR